METETQTDDAKTKPVKEKTAKKTKPVKEKTVKEKTVKEKTAKKTKPVKEKTAKKTDAKKEKASDEPFEHDERVLPYVGQTLTHTERDGTTHELQVRVDGFYIGKERYNSATAAAKPLQPIDEKTGKTRAVNGLVYWNIVKTPRAALSPEAALESAQKAIDRVLERSAVAIEAAGEKKAPVRRALENFSKKFAKLLESVAAA